jgi:hypothetical protein
MNKPLKLHIGCGERRLKGYCHVDIRNEVSPDICASVLDLSIIESNSVQEIYFCHGIEHIRESQVPVCLKELHRILSPGAILRLALPDFYALVTLYCAGRASLSEIVYAIHGQQDYADNTHFFSWDYHTLGAKLVQHGFGEVTRYSAKEFLPPGYFDWSLHCIAGTPTSLNIIARKPEHNARVQNSVIQIF